jgi:hypothetical protein
LLLTLIKDSLFLDLLHVNMLAVFFVDSILLQFLLTQLHPCMKEMSHM